MMPPMPKNKEPSPRRTFTPLLKQQIVDPYRGGKSKCDIIREYDIAYSLCRRITVVPLRKKIAVLQKMQS